MATSFDWWEKDPFFPAAEGVQESADRDLRMESLYRTWIHAKKDNSSIWNSEELRRDLQTALGTTKWQLEEFARAVQSSYVKNLSDDSRGRHREFIIAIGDKILKTERSLEESARSDGEESLPWVRLDEGECNELALFLSGPSDNDIMKPTGHDSAPECSKNASQFNEQGSVEAVEEKRQGHRRTASASADISAWKIAINDDGNQQNSSNGQPMLPPRKISSVSGFLNSMESVAKLKWPKNGIRKWKAERFQEADIALLRPSQLTRGINACYEKSKSCLESGDDCYNKQLYGWYGVIQRQLQRSQYQMQYSRPVQVALWIVLLCFIGLITVCNLKNSELSRLILVDFLCWIDRSLCNLKWKNVESSSGILYYAAGRGWRVFEEY